MGNGSIKINTSAVRAHAERVRTLNKNINCSLDALTGQISALSRDWDGSAAEHAISTYSKLRADYYNNRYAQVDNFVNFLTRNVAGGYESAEKNNRSLSDAFK